MNPAASILMAFLLCILCGFAIAAMPSSKPPRKRRPAWSFLDLAALTVLAMQANHDEAKRRRMARRNKGDAGELGAWGGAE